MENKNIHEKIIWINSLNKDSGINNNFYYNIFGVLHPEAKNITLQLLDCLIMTSTSAYFFNKAAIMILLNFNVSHNQFSKSTNNFIVGGIITPQQQYKTYYSEQLFREGPIYEIRSFPDGLMNVRIIDHSYADLIDNNNAVPSSVIICLKFTYEI